MHTMMLLGFTPRLLVKGDKTGVFPSLLNAGYLYQVVPLKQRLDRIPLARRPASPHKAISSRCSARSLICRNAPRGTKNALALGYLARGNWAGFPDLVLAPNRASG